MEASSLVVHLNISCKPVVINNGNIYLLSKLILNLFSIQSDVHTASGHGFPLVDLSAVYIHKCCDMTCLLAEGLSPLINYGSHSMRYLMA